MRVFKIFDLKNQAYVGKALRTEGVPKIWSTINSAKTAIAAGVRHHRRKYTDYMIHVFDLHYVEQKEYQGRENAKKHQH